MEMGLASYNSYEFELLFPNISSSLGDYQRLAPSTRHRIYVPLLYVVLFVTGIVGNAWVIYVIACVRWLGSQRPPTGSIQLFVSNVPHHTTPNCNCQRAGIRRQSRQSVQQQQNYVQRMTGSGGSISRLSRTARNVQVYIMCLCCCDLVVLVFLLFLISDLIVGQWPIQSTFLCRAYLASESVNKFCVPFLLVALSGYCYATVAQCETAIPLSATSAGGPGHSPGSRSVSAYQQWIDFRSPLTSAFLCICAGFALVIPVYLYSGIKYFISYNETSEEIRWVMSKCGFHPPDSVFTVFTSYSFVCGYVLPSILFTCFYSSVLRVVYKRAKRSADADSRRTPRTYRLSSVAKTTLGLVFFYQLCWTPYWTMTVWLYWQSVNLHGDSKYSASGVELALFVHVLPYINCTGYPIVYTLMNKNIKETYHRIRETRRARRESIQLDWDEPCPCQRAETGRVGLMSCLRKYFGVDSNRYLGASVRNSIDYRRRTSRLDSLSEKLETETKVITTSEDIISDGL